MWLIDNELVTAERRALLERQVLPLGSLQEVVRWGFALAPPAAIVDRMSTEINRIVHAPDTKARLLQQGVEAIGTTPEQFAKFIQTESVRYARIIKESGAKAD